MTLRELAAAIQAELIGEAGDAEVLGITGLDAMAAGCVAYVAEARSLPEAEAGPALALLVPTEIPLSAKPLLRAPDPRLALARALDLLLPAERLLPGVHPTAEIGAGVGIGEGAALSAHCVIGEGAVIGRITDFHGTLLETIRAPFAGEILYVVGTPAMNKGEPVAFIGERKN